MPGLAPISEVSSDTTRSEVSIVSRESRLEAIRRLRYGPRSDNESSVRPKATAAQSTSTLSPKHGSIGQPDTAKLSHSSQAVIATRPDGPKPGPQGRPATRLGSQTSYNAEDESLDGSGSSLNLDSYAFPVPPSNSAMLSPPNTRNISDRDSAKSLPVQPWIESEEHDSNLLLLARSPHPLSPRTPALQHSPHHSPAFRGFTDGATSIPRSRPVSAVDSTLIEAISRSVLEQLCMLSLSSRRGSGRESANTPMPSRASEQSIHTQSRTSSQKEALKRFAKELHKYAEHTNARGKMPRLTPSSKSPATLHTISALLPYRREFKDARLAVTSKDQAQKSRGEDRLRPVRRPPRQALDTDGEVVNMSRMDGTEGMVGEQHSISEVSFVRPGNIDEWRYALVEELPPRSSKMRTGKAKRLCLPCFTSPLDGRENFQENVKRSTSSQPLSKAPGAAMASRSKESVKAPYHIPMPSNDVVSAEPSPRHMCDGVGSMQPLNAHLKATGCRRPSMTISRTNGHLESCRGGHSYTHPDAEIHRHNPRPTTTQHLDADATIGTQAGPVPYRPGPSNLLEPQVARNGPRINNGASLPTLAILKDSSSAIPPPLRHTLGHLPDLTHDGKRKLVVRNPTEPDSKPVFEPASEKLFPKSFRKRASIATRRRSKLLGSRRFRPVIPVRESSILQSVRSVELDSDRHVTDRQVLRGLHVATSAACDEEVDSYVGDRTGVRIRQFLADLVALESYWSDAQSSGNKEQRARQRRAQMRKLKQHIRQSRVVRRVSDQSS